MEESLTAQQISEMVHAIGGKYVAKPYRNYFCTSGDDEKWNDLVVKGFATKRKDGLSSSYVFHVSDKGMDFLKTINN